MAFGGPRHSTFATFLILCRTYQLLYILHRIIPQILTCANIATSFFLGILFSLFPYDYPLLWTAAEAPPSAFASLETHLAYLHVRPFF